MWLKNDKLIALEKIFYFVQQKEFSFETCVIQNPLITMNVS